MMEVVEEEIKGEGVTGVAENLHKIKRMLKLN